MSSIIHMILHVPISFLANYVVDKCGCRAGALISGLFLLFGCWTRLLVKYNFAWVYIGQVCVGVANPFSINVLNKISANWFYP